MNDLKNILLIVAAANFFIQIMIDNDAIETVSGVITFIIVAMIVYIQNKRHKQKK